MMKPEPLGWRSAVSIRWPLGAALLAAALSLAVPASGQAAPAHGHSARQAAAGSATPPRVAHPRKRVSGRQTGRQGRKAGVKAQPRMSQGMSQEARDLVKWVMDTRDNEGAPFIVIDKKGARLWLFDALGHPWGQTPVLLGLARGDASVPGIGEREMSAIARHERTTPAGRFIAEPGRNMSGEDIFWIDYDAAVSLHRVRATNPAERRLQRLATPTAADNRISYGCINVPAAFYDERIHPLFMLGRGVVYLLPEKVPLNSLFTHVGTRVDDGTGTRLAAAAPVASRRSGGATAPLPAAWP